MDAVRQRLRATARSLALVALLAGLACQPVQAGDALNRLNRRISGRVVDHTKNHGRNNAIPSAILCQKRDLYVYLPPGYDETKRYPLILWVHGAFGDESAVVRGTDIRRLDKMIQDGLMPPVIFAAMDATYEGVNRLTAQHSFLVNGEGGRFEDHLMVEILPFLLANYAIRPEREGHAISGMSGGGFAALSIAMKHPEFFSKVAVLSAPINLRYWSEPRGYFGNFDPTTYRWRTHYDPKEVVGVYACVVRIKAGWIVDRVVGDPNQAIARVQESNPADLLFTKGLKPNELDIYINYSSHDNFNFDAQSESFAWLAEQVGLPITIKKDNLAWHKLPYFRRNQWWAFEFLGDRLQGPTSARSQP